MVEWLNTYFDAMVGVVFGYGGTVDKIMGDGLLVYFGAPEPNPNHSRDAVHCALAMLRRLESLNVEASAKGWPAYSIGVGLHAGPAILGNIGSERRTDYTVIGDTVNIASRLEGLTKSLESPIVASETCRDAAGGNWDRLEDVPIRGRSEPLALFAPVDADA